MCVSDLFQATIDNALASSHPTGALDLAPVIPS